MSWKDEEARVALLELVATGELPRRASQEWAWEQLGPLQWVQPTRRRDVVALDASHRGDVEKLLDRVWPEWRDVLVRLEAEQLSKTRAGLRELADRDRARAVPSELPGRLNQKTAAAAVGRHSKVVLAEGNRKRVEPAEVTRDGVARLRPNPGLTLSRGGRTFEASTMAEVLGEVVVSDRAFRDGLVFGGTAPKAVLTVENLGAYVDVPVPAGWLVVHVPGWDTSALPALLKALPGVPVVHFGDLDPNGVRIVRHIRTLVGGLIWFVPEFWREHVPSRALRCSWPEELDLEHEPALVGELAQAGMWLEQEMILLDSRLDQALDAVLVEERG